MYEQHRIPSTLSDPETLARVKALMAVAGARLDDVRLGKRLVQIVQRQGEAPTKSFPGAAPAEESGPAGAGEAGSAGGTALAGGGAGGPGPAGGPKLRLVHVREQTQPEGAERLEWFLLTTLAVQTQQKAERVLEWYKLRWRIEDWYRVLKSGCKVEYLGHRQGERIERAVTINAVIAWRLTLMTLLGRNTPELSADTLFTEIELAALEDFAQDRRQLPPDNLGRAVLTLAMLGGYLNYKRKQYAVPGHKVMWEGYTRLATITQVVERTRRLNEGSKLYQKMRRE